MNFTFLSEGFVLGIWNFACGPDLTQDLNKFLITPFPTHLSFVDLNYTPSILHSQSYTLHSSPGILQLSALEFDIEETLLVLVTEGKYSQLLVLDWAVSLTKIKIAFKNAEFFAFRNIKFDIPSWSQHVSLFC